jgi:hypothetical protein
MLNNSYIFLQEKVHNDHPVCEVTHTHTHTYTIRHPPEKDKEGILHAERERERERERTRECTTREAKPAILNQNDLLRKPQRMILMEYCCCRYIDSRASHDYLDMTLVAPLSSS